MSYIVQDVGWSRISLAACEDVYCQGLAQGIKAKLFEKHIAINTEFTIPAVPNALDAKITVQHMKPRVGPRSCEQHTAGPPIVILIMHAAEELLKAAQEQNFWPLWLGSEGIAADLGAFKDVRSANNVMMTRLASQATQRAMLIEQRLGKRTDHFIPTM